MFCLTRTTVSKCWPNFFFFSFQLFWHCHNSRAAGRRIVAPDVFADISRLGSSSGDAPTGEGVQPPPHSDDYIREKGPQYFIQICVRRHRLFRVEKMEAPAYGSAKPARRRRADVSGLVLMMPSPDFVILGGGSFKENAAMRLSDAFEASIIERNPGV